MKERYDNIDGLRALGAAMIVLMHVGANMSQVQDMLVYKIAISKFGLFVVLFFVISGFGMCCGYYEKIKSGNISLDTFYSRRYLKTLPFVTVLILIELVVGYAELRTWVESFASMTLLYGLLPTSGTFTVLGVGWTLGVEFAFYCIFPFFVYGLWTKKRAMVFLILATVGNVLCENYFTINGSIIAMNIIRWLVTFVAGGLIYLYKDQIVESVRKNRIKWALVCIFSTILATCVDFGFIGIRINTLLYVICFSVWLCYAIGCKSILLSNNVTRFLSKISLEIYLSHMLLYRIVELLHVERWISNSVILYGINYFLTLSATIIFILCVKYLLNKAQVLVGKVLG